MKRQILTAALFAVLLAGCHHWCRRGDECAPGGKGHQLPLVDRPFPVGQVSDSFWETQQTNAEAADFIFYDHEFRGNTAELAPGAKKHLEQVALRLSHVPFPVVVEQSPHNKQPQVDQARRQTIVLALARMGVLDVENRVIVANAFPEGLTAQEAEGAYYGGVLTDSFGGGSGRRFGGTGAVYR
jgi:hypothetical protein